MIDEIVQAIKRGNKILICGNGGLAAESEHFAAEMMGKFAFDVFIPCVALTANTSLITALGNDIGFENVFAHQVRSLGRKGDILIGMTTSNSKNVLKALQVGKELGLYTICFCGYGFEQQERISCYTIRAKNKTNTQTIQEDILHSLHELAHEIKRLLYDSRQSEP